MGSILIVAEIQGGQIRESSFELAAFAQKIAAATGREVTSLVLGKDIANLADDFAKKGGGKVFVADDELLANYCVESANAAIRAAVEASGADVILLSNTPNGWDIAPRIAAGLDAGFVIYDSDDQRALIKRLLKAEGLEDLGTPRSFLSRISLHGYGT